jgi:hypothetical protein
VTPSDAGEGQASTAATTTEPAAPAPHDGRSAVSFFLLGALWVLVATLLQLARQEGVSPLDTVWAEDGSVFLVGAMSDPLGAIPDLYTGYLHVVPRLVAVVASVVPLTQASLILSGGAAFIVALLSLYVLVATSGIFRERWAPVALAAMMVVVPAAGIEAANNVTNLRWFLLFAAFWALLHRVRSPAGVVVSSIVVAAATLSDPLTLLLLPLAVIAWMSRDFRRRAVVIVFAIGGVIQGGVALGSLVSGAGRPPMVGALDITDLIGLFGLRVAGSFLVGEQFLDNAWRFLGWGFAAVALTVVAALAAYGLARAHGARRWLIGGTLFSAVVAYSIPVATRGTSPLVPDGGDIHPLIGTRYVVAPILFLVSMTLLILDASDPRVSEVTWRRVQQAFLLVAAALVLVNFSVATMRSPGPAWNAELDSADRRCAVPGVTEAEVPITPRVPPETWELHLQCDEVRQAR